MPPRRASSFNASQSGASPVPSTYPGKGMHEAQWQACTGILEAAYQARDGNRRTADIFRELPDEEDYADYYEAIPEPEALDNVANRLREGTYDTAEAFFKQLHLVFLNAKHYNEQESQIWIDAQQLETQILDAWRSRATEGIFANPDPYFRAPPRRGRPPKHPDQRVPSAPRASATPVPRPPMPTPEPPLMPRQSSRSRSTSAQPYITATSPTPSEKVRRYRQTEADRAIVAALDARLPRWSGPQPGLPGGVNLCGVDGSGWWGEGAPDYEMNAGGERMWPNRIKGVAEAISGYRDPSGARLADAFDAIPAMPDIPYLSFHAPITFGAIRSSATSHRYRTLRDFDLDMTHLFEKARRFHRDGSAEYGHVLVLQRLYNALTAPYPLILPPSGVPAPSSTLFASLPAGPGNARPLHETTQELRAGAAEEDVGFGVTTYRVGTRDRTFTDEARHKGLSFRVGDYVHLINPDDATRPIVGQVFKTFVPTKGYRTHHLTVCWYYRPEQTVHTADRMFFEREVFKSGHFCDHPVQDVLERVSCQFYVKYIRGRPQAGEFYPGWPSYICHSRYNDREWLTVRIKNWGSCIPDELRQTNFMSTVPYERHLEPPMVKSPFLRGITGPGFIGEPKSKPSGEDDEDLDEPSKRVVRTSDRPRRGNPTPPQPYIPLPPVANGHHDPRPAVPGSLRYPTQTAPTPTSIYRNPQQNAQPQYTSGSGQAGRTIVAMMGGQQIMDQIALREVLPHDTARLFERDARQQVLWFSGPPLAPGTVHVPVQPSHSIEYLEYLAKRKRGVVDSEEAGRRKGARYALSPAGEGRQKEQDAQQDGDENLGKTWWAQGMNADQIAAGLRAVIESA